MSRTSRSALVALCTFDEGYAIQILESPDELKVGRVADLGTAPQAALRDSDGSILIATVHGGLLRLLPDLRVERVLDAHWIAPHRMVRGGDGALYIAMRSVIARLQLDHGQPEERWLVPPH